MTTGQRQHRWASALLRSPLPRKYREGAHWAPMYTTPSIILGSGSPRRAEILSFFHLPFEVIPSHFDEESIAYEGDPAGYVQQLARSKAYDLMTHHRDRTILCADTAVFIDDVVLNKPKDRAEAEAMLTQLSGRWHTVVTGVAVRRGTTEFFGSQQTRLLFKPLSLEQIRLYQHGLHTLDKAGGYAIQGAGSMVVERIDGCFYNTMGLPLTLTTELLQHVGIDLWHHIGLH
jgi:septum formation protein